VKVDNWHNIVSYWFRILSGEKYKGRVRLLKRTGSGAHDILCL